MKTPKTGRNNPCPCGSGRKFKKCCAPRDIAFDKSEAQVNAGHDQKSARPCDDCSLCCEGWVKTRVLGHEIDVGHPCPYSSGHHCTIHEKRPEDPCRIFFCGWAEQNSRLPVWMQPNKCGVIVLTGRSAWRGLPVDILVSAGRDLDEKVFNWFKQHSVAVRRPFIFQLGESWYGFGPPEFQAEIAAKAKRGEPLWT